MTERVPEVTTRLWQNGWCDFFGPCGRAYHDAFNDWWQLLSPPGHNTGIETTDEAEAVLWCALGWLP